MLSNLSCLQNSDNSDMYLLRLCFRIVGFLVVRSTVSVRFGLLIFGSPDGLLHSASARFTRLQLDCLQTDCHAFVSVDSPLARLLYFWLGLLRLQSIVSPWRTYGLRTNFKLITDMIKIMLSKFWY